MVPANRRTAIGCLGVLVALLGTACSAGAERPAPSAAAPSTASASVPAAAPPPCTLALDGGQVALTADQAVTATDAAADLVRADGGDADPARLAARLASVTPLAPVADAASRALLGRRGPALTCAHPRAASDGREPGRSGLTPRGDALLASMQEAFGTLPTGGYASGGIDSGHVADSSHYDGRAIDVFFRPRSSTEQQRRGWTLAQWLVARADRQAVLSVIYRDRIWTVWASSAGWRDYVHPSGDTENPVLRHLDHVHTAVVGERRAR